MLAWLVVGAAQANVDLPQADGSTLELDRPAQRIVTLAPNLAELAYAAGAGDLLVATVEYSDYPPEAAALPRIGDAFRFDLERILALRPDLVVTWQSGNPAPAQAALEKLGLRVWRTEIRKPADIADLLEAVGRATGREATATAAANHLRTALDSLRARYARRAPVRYFYQVAERPLYTVNGQHLISRALAVCGGENVFADLPGLAPQISPEAVLQADPDVLIAPRISSDDEPLAKWLAWPRMRAVQAGALLYVPADEISRATPRLLDGIEVACKRLDSYRQSRQAEQRAGP